MTPKLLILKYLFLKLRVACSAACLLGTSWVDHATIFASRDGISDGTICAAETRYYYYCTTCPADTFRVDLATIFAARDGISDGHSVQL